MRLGALECGRLSCRMGPPRWGEAMVGWLDGEGRRGERDRISLPVDACVRPEAEVGGGEGGLGALGTLEGDARVDPGPAVNCKGEAAVIHVDEHRDARAGGVAADGRESGASRCTGHAKLVRDDHAAIEAVIRPCRRACHVAAKGGGVREGMPRVTTGSEECHPRGVRRGVTYHSVGGRGPSDRWLHA